MTTMAVIERDIQVSFRHQIHFTHDVFAAANPLLKMVLANAGERRICRVWIILDKRLATAQPAVVDQIPEYFAIHSSVLELASSPILIEGGERVKNSTSYVSQLHSEVERCRLDRHSYMVAVGGGALLDMVGLAAATAHRGLRHVRLPSTTLSQNDSGIGVKNGINSNGVPTACADSNPERWSG